MGVSNTPCTFQPGPVAYKSASLERPILGSNVENELMLPPNSKIVAPQNAAEQALFDQLIRMQTNRMKNTPCSSQNSLYPQQSLFLTQVNSSNSTSCATTAPVFIPSKMSTSSTPQILQLLPNASMLQQTLIPAQLLTAQTQQAQAQPGSSRYKTELCRPFEENGFCKYGDKCQFAHGTQDIRTLSRHPKYKTEWCRTYHSTGICPYGPRCHFIHDESEFKLNNIKNQQQQHAFQQQVLTAQQVILQQIETASMLNQMPVVRPPVTPMLPTTTTFSESSRSNLQLSFRSTSGDSTRSSLSSSPLSPTNSNTSSGIGSGDEQVISPPLPNHFRESSADSGISVTSFSLLNQQLSPTSSLSSGISVDSDVFSPIDTTCFRKPAFSAEQELNLEQLHRLAADLTLTDNNNNGFPGAADDTFIKNTLNMAGI